MSARQSRLAERLYRTLTPNMSSERMWQHAGRRVVGLALEIRNVDGREMISDLCGSL